MVNAHGHTVKASGHAKQGLLGMPVMEYHRELRHVFIYLKNPSPLLRYGEGEDRNYLCRRQEGPVVPSEKVCRSLGISTPSNRIRENGFASSCVVKRAVIPL